MAQSPRNLAVPMKVDAFVFNPRVCDGKPEDAKIAPITQPNYTFLQLKDSLIQHDILDRVDLHNAIPATTNPRLTDLGQGTQRSNRVGVYLHWVLPRFYRIGAAATPSAAKSHTQHRQKKGLRTSAAEDPAQDYSAPDFRPLPNRWLVIRTVDPDASTTVPNRSQGAEIKPVEAWVIESDRLRSIDDLTLDDADLQIDVSPYITANTKSTGHIRLQEQAETFIGYRHTASNWSEDQDQERVDLTAVSSSNQLFVDYQPHCSNVFSMLDTFDCKINGKEDRLSSAVASYYVLGWHSNPKDGPLGNLDPTSDLTREGRLQSLSMTLKGSPPWPDTIQKWLGSKSPAPVLCHGAMYEVEWHVSQLPTKVPANDASHLLLDSMPVAVGTTPIDSLLTYIDTHHETSLEQDLRHIGPLLRAQDEGVDAHRIASDELQNWNFSRESGGQHWYFQNPPGQPAVKPTLTEAENLELLNQAQRVVDSTNRQILQLRWEMFSYWWKYASASEADRGHIQFPIEQLSKRTKQLSDLATDQKRLVDQLSRDKKKFPQLPQNGVLSEFNQPRDPTLLVAGIQAGWPDDYLDSLAVRLDTQLVVPEKKVDGAAYCTHRLPVELQDTARDLVQEFEALRNPVRTGDGHYLPLYHDHGKHGADVDPLRDQWAGTQPWAPLFLEWEAQYFHIPWDDWALTGHQKDVVDQRWRLGIAPGVDLQKPVMDDSRTLYGRILLLPQPNFSLQAAINQLFSSIDPETLEKYLPTKEQRDEVLHKTYTLPFLSAPLDGFTDHLLTLVQGTHIKPNARYPEQGLNPIADAVLGPFGTNELQVIDIHSELTPYGSLVHFTNAPPTDDTELKPTEPSKPFPFKPVTHGQFRFSKLNIIDKFGQAISAIDPRYGHEEDEVVYPHISDYFEPQLRPDGQPNVVRPPARPGYCEFVQVPPGINQPARLNSAFMVYDERYGKDRVEYSYWRPVTEWENPIWGWLVVNYVDYGIQVFQPDGTFYREVRIASPTAPQTTSTSAKWLPFSPPETPPKTGQLDHLLEKLSEPDQEYLLAFLDMTNRFLESTSSVPSAYATFLNSLVGRPLALVNAGWSLELSTDVKKNQADLDDGDRKQPPTGLLDGDEIYDFPVKLGDENRASDGLVGYFKTRADLKPGNELNLTEIFTYQTRDTDRSTGPLRPISSANFPKFRTFWLEPDKYIGRNRDPSQTAQEFGRDWNRSFQVFGAIIDPFTPLTAYSSILPTNTLKLPPWTWQQALDKMTAFFHLGPMMVTEDVQQYYNRDKTLSPQYQLNPPSSDATVTGSAVGIPSLQTGSWAWLQPFIDPSSQDQKYMALGLGKVDNRPKFQKGPYTAIEGYLQLKAPIIRADESTLKTSENEKKKKKKEGTE